MLHHERKGDWPNQDSGPVIDITGETWSALNAALLVGCRGLAGGSSLAKLLDEKRGVRNLGNLPPLTEERILNWADSHKQRTGKWPVQNSGSIDDAPGETWPGINTALQKGTRGLPGGSSIVKLLEEKRGIRNQANLPYLTEEQILKWADAHKAHTGKWPKRTSGPVTGALHESWSAIANALVAGLRGLPGGSSLAVLLEEKRGVRNHLTLPPLTEEQILKWADAHKERTGDWPGKESGIIAESPRDTWVNVNTALRVGLRGLGGSSSLTQLLADKRGVSNSAAHATLTIEQILAWADAYHERTGNWPKRRAGGIPEAPGENWANVDAALQRGSRGLSGKSSLVKLLAERRGVRNSADRSSLSIEQILNWADTYHARTGDWPKARSGDIPEAPGESWANIDVALSAGATRASSRFVTSQTACRGTRRAASLRPTSDKGADSYLGRFPSQSPGKLAGGRFRPNPRIARRNMAEHRPCPSPRDARS